jgi:hypothetical protein
MLDFGRLFMKNWLVYGLLTSSALGSGLVFPAMAKAQTAPQQPPQYQSIDENGVDPAKRILEKSLASVSIGPEGPEGLQYSWSTNAAVDRAQLQGYISAPSVLNNGTQVYVALNERSVTFVHANGVFTPEVKNGSTLVKSGSTWTYTDSGGTVSTFVGASNPPLQSAVYPSGARRDFFYDPNGNVTAVTNNAGYQLRITNSNIGGAVTPTQAVAFNMALENCAPTAPTCTLSGNWSMAKP